MLDEQFQQCDHEKENTVIVIDVFLTLLLHSFSFDEG